MPLTTWRRLAALALLLAAGFNHHLTQPVDVAQLLQLVAHSPR